MTPQERRTLIGVSSIAGLLAAVAALWAWDRRLVIVDLTAESPAEKRSMRGGEVDAVTLHATGFSRGNNPADYAKVTAHFVVLPNGVVAALHPTSARLPASNGFNDRSIAVEFIGNFPSARDQWWRPEEFGRDKVSPRQILAGRKLLRRLKRTDKVTHVFAHRQSAPERQNDPGPHLWLGVGEWAKQSLGLSDGGPDFKIATGRTIPPEWRTA